MLDWRRITTETLIPAVENDQFWAGYLSQLVAGQLPRVGLHLAIFVEPYLTFILNGRKTVESRFGVKRGAPYGRVARGDILLLKRSSGPVQGICLVSDAWFYKLHPGSWTELRDEFAEALCAQDPAFWAERQHASFATLMRVSSARGIQPFMIQKQDRRGWVVLRQPQLAHYVGTLFE